MAKIVNIATIEQLEQLTGKKVEPEARLSMGEVLEKFPVRITKHLLDLIPSSKAIADQFLPDAREVGTDGGQEFCFQGLLEVGIAGVERMYPDRCIIMPQPACPAYCRFCFRKFYEHEDVKAMSYDDLDQALSYVAREKLLREVLITGGEPVMDPKRLSYLLKGLRKISHIGVIRVACRSLIMAPHLIDEPMVQLLREHQDLRAGKPVEVACHANHPDEITLPTVEAIVRLKEAGIHVYNQTVLLKGINCEAEVLLELFRRLRAVGVESYYMFFGGPVQGMDYQRPTIGEALSLKSALRREATGRIIPQLIITTRIGKVEIGVDGWVVEREEDGRHVWIRTPYTLESLRRVDRQFELPKDGRVDQEGCIVMKYLDGPSAGTFNR